MLNGSTYTVPSSVPWKTQPTPTACLATCNQMTGYNADPRNAINTATYNANGQLASLPTAKQGVATIDSYLSQNKRITVGVDNGVAGTFNSNPATKHFVAIDGYGYANDKKFYHFLDPATTNEDAGTSLQNRLYLNIDDYSLSGQSQYTPYDGIKKNYTVTEVRP